MDANRSPRVVLVHDWLTGMRGGEKCLQVLCRRWPDAPLYTLLHRRGSVDPVIENRAIRASFLNRLPGVHRYYRYLLPFMPLAASGWRLPACDLVVSLSHCVAKSAQPPAGVPHVCYCFTPMRYAWHLRAAYFGEGRWENINARTLDRMLEALRQWDRETSERVTHFIAISQTVRRRIQECYDRESTVIYPPVDTDFFCPAPVRRGDFYLAFSAFAPYKRLDLAVEACRRLGRELVVIGSGQAENKWRALAGDRVRFLGWQSDEVIRDHLRRCRALLFPGEEDFGIIPVEAQACGTPVIAFGRGGATETIVAAAGRRLGEGEGEGEATGILFPDQTIECLIDAIEQLEDEPDRYAAPACRRQALRFNRNRFEDEIDAYLRSVLRQSEQPRQQAA